jgi:hypothetical protein
MKRIAFLLPDGVGIRNYLYSNILKELLKKGYEPILLHILSESAIKEVNDYHDYNFAQKKISPNKETFTEKFYRELISISRLKYNIALTNNYSLMDNWRPNKKNAKNKIFYFLVEICSFFVSKNYNRILSLENSYDNLAYDNSNDALLKELNLDIIFCTHQRSVAALPLIKAAKSLGIKTYGVIFSWDNLPKARLTVKTDKYLVWSEHMKEEAKLFYPEIPQDKIVITGTPQFEFYCDNNLIIPKHAFFDTYGLDISKKTICFSGDDIRTSPYDPDYLNDLAYGISQLSETRQPQILLRRCPVDLTGRFNVIVEKYKSIIKVADPLWNFDKNNKEKWTLVYPKFEDVALLVNTVKHCDVVVNVGSTMAHDFAMFKKPAIYINYDVPHAKNWSVKTIYEFQHFKSMGTLQPVFWLNSKKSIIDVLNKAFDADENSKEVKDGQKWLDLVANKRKEASFNIVNLLISN